MGNKTPRKTNNAISESTLSSPRSKPKTPRKETENGLENCENLFVLCFQGFIIALLEYLNPNEQGRLMLACKALHSAISPHLICFGIQMKQMERALDGYWEGSGIFVHFHKKKNKVRTWTGTTLDVVMTSGASWRWIKASSKENHFLIKIQCSRKILLYKSQHRSPNYYCGRWSNFSPFPSDQAIYEVRISNFDENNIQLEMQATHGSHFNSVVVKKVSHRKFYSRMNEYYPCPADTAMFA